MKYTRENREVTYIHYGAKEFNPQKFIPVINRVNWVKPEAHTGLWASPVNAEWGWKDWCEAENFRECDDDVSFKFTVRDPQRIFFVDSKDSYDELVRLYGIKNPLHFGYTPDFIDFNKMMEEGWHGLEISITDYPALYDLLYGWDCDSILIFNKDAIIPFNTEEKEVTIHDEFEAAIEGDSLGSGIFGEWETLLHNNQFS